MWLRTSGSRSALGPLDPDKTLHTSRGSDLGTAAADLDDLRATDSFRNDSGDGGELGAFWPIF